MDQTIATQDIYDDTPVDNNNDNNDIPSNIMNQEQTTNTQSQVVGKDAKVSEMLVGINTFLDNLKNAQVGGNASIIANEREKVSKLFNVLSLSDLLNALQANQQNVSDK